MSAFRPPTNTIIRGTLITSCHGRPASPGCQAIAANVNTSAALCHALVGSVHYNTAGAIIVRVDDAAGISDPCETSIVPSGKVSAAFLRQVVLSHVGPRRSDVLVRAGIGEDAAVIAFGDEVCVTSSDPITGARSNAGWLSVHVNCNDIATAGAEPIGVLATLLLPTNAEEDLLATIVQDIHRAATELGVEVVGGHTEFMDALSEPIISVTAIGRASRDHYLSSAGARPGDAIVMTKVAAIEGTAILATDFAAELEGSIDPDLAEQARHLLDQISVVRDGRVAAAFGATAMHDATEGGILGALAELAEASGRGMRVRVEAIPLHPATEAICSHFGLDPLRLISSGSMIVTAPDGPAMVEALGLAGIQSTVIGEVTESIERRLLLRGKQLPLLAPPRDELWRLLDERGRS